MKPFPAVLARSIDPVILAAKAELAAASSAAAAAGRPPAGPSAPSAAAGGAVVKAEGGSASGPEARIRAREKALLPVYQQARVLGVKRGRPAWLHAWSLFA